MLSERLQPFFSANKGAPSRHPELVAFIADKVPERRSQKVAWQLVNRLLELFERHGRAIPALERLRLEREYAHRGSLENDPVDGWRYALPIALPGEQRLRVSRVLSAVVAAADPRFSCVGLTEPATA